MSSVEGAGSVVAGWRRQYGLNPVLIKNPDGTYGYEFNTNRHSAALNKTRAAMGHHTVDMSGIPPHWGRRFGEAAVNGNGSSEE